VNYVVEEEAHGFTRRVGETEVGWLAMMAARENASRRDIDTIVLSDDGRTSYKVLAGGREIVPYSTYQGPVDNDQIAEWEKHG